MYVTPAARAGELKPGEEAVEPMALFVAPLIVNIAYTAGWVVEIVTREVAAPLLSS